MRLIRKRVGALLIVACAAVLVAPSFRAAQQTPLNYAALFEKSEVMIPMRDGGRLHTEIYSPKNAEGERPVLMNRTPYGISAADKGVKPMIYRHAVIVQGGGI